MSHDGQTLDIAHPSDLSPQATACFLVLEDMPSGRRMPGGAAHFKAERSPSKGVTVLVPEQGAVYEIVDRRIKSVTRTDETGAIRADVLEWQDTDDNRFLPSRVMLTEFDASGGIKAVTILNSVFSLQDGIHIPQRHYGTRIAGSETAGDFAIEVSDLSVTGDNASNSS